jgi:hypothetical protein
MPPPMAMLTATKTAWKALSLPRRLGTRRSCDRPRCCRGQFQVAVLGPGWWVARHWRGREGMVGELT